MKKILSALSTLVLTTTLSLLGRVEADTSVQFGVGYRTDDLKWQIKLPDNLRLDSHSKLRFKDLEIFTIQARLKGGCGDCMYYRIDGQYGWILDGTVRETLRLAIPGATDNTNPVSFIIPNALHNDVKGKYVADFNIGFAYPLQQCWCPGLQLAPTIGFAYDTIRIRQDNDERFQDELAFGIADDFGIGLIAFKNHSKYRTTWWGPYLGLDFAYCHHDCWNLYGEFEYHFTRTRRERNSDVGLTYLDDYERTRGGSGVSLRLGSIYFFRCNWFLDGYIKYKRWQSNEHRDELVWTSWIIAADLGYMF
jgi:hypothetical protein